MPHVALQDFCQGKWKFKTGDVLPRRSRYWANLRELQRKGWVSRRRDASVSVEQAAEVKHPQPEVTRPDTPSTPIASRYFQPKRRKG